MNREKLKTAKRIVIKIGTSSLILANGQINLKNMDDLAFTLSSLRNEGYDIILVTSGAIGVGLNVLGMDKRPSEIAQQQALASIGQVELMSLYNHIFARYQQKVSQLLLTNDVIEYPESRQNASMSLQAILSMGIIPIINENDAVSVDEMDHKTKFGDNDRLGAIVTNLADADLLIMLSDIDGLYDKNPNIFDDAKLIDTVSEITDELMKVAGGAGSRFGTGGMTSKLEAAKLIFDNDKQMVLTNGARIREIRDIISGKKKGTYFGQ
ncbi:MAG: glutamate 5-kinase [Lactococcus raffinolactis]|jgi:glutamate 5-kinase|uniref:Glutamate 5-kinase n=1 Tax=Pseudolactococcus raffinolactis TaxID=1366 RepID=A0A2A5SGL3_9LACT|nr:glutamate 5-kinase [Lactococcus raffinolactis]MBP6301523.1 glutamate 5-kinase [Lactococcus sp.]ATC60587.1 glutamate 5-kinase [Lactococcus raffinolactis]MBR2541865.1 glutamate 5-kinase [Lactococcus sp.]MBW9331252.1 glutamate 5-kinase [Lactococcus raffinolactis]MDG4961576.1 glutamate 5-kinase [Lactococcus raffinolactis]